VNNVLIRENDLIKNSTLDYHASTSQTVSLGSLGWVILIIIIFYILAQYLSKEKPKDEEDHQEFHHEKDIEKYSMDIQWSEEDNAYIVTVPELPGCITHGRTYEEAVRQGKDAIESWIDASLAWGDPIPPPRV